MLESALLHRRVTDLLRTAKFLLLLMIIYNVIEGDIAVSSGLIAGSIAPVAFGADSYIKVFAATLVLWRIGVADDERAEVVDRITVRAIVWTFIALSAAIVFRSTLALIVKGKAKNCQRGGVKVCLSHKSA